MNMTIKFSIRADILRGMAVLTSKDESRPALTHVCLAVESETLCKLIATDGRAMGIFLCSPGDVVIEIRPGPAPYKISIPIPNFAKLGCKASEPIKVEQSTSEGFRRFTTFSFGQWRQMIETSAAQYPETNGVLPPQTAPIRGIDLNLNLLNKFSECLRFMGYTNHGYFHLRGGGIDETGNKRALHLFPDSAARNQFYGVIMPLRDDGEYTIPPWVLNTPRPADNPAQSEPLPEPTKPPTEATPTQETATQDEGPLDNNPIASA